jgi:hypothetical protein
MAIIATNTAIHHLIVQPIAAGSYAARCYSMIQLGTNEETIQGVAKKLKQGKDHMGTTNRNQSIQGRKW